MDKNCIEGAAKQGERARNREALVTKAKWRKCSGLCDEGVRSYLGKPRLDPERVTVLNRSEDSAEVIVVVVAELRRLRVKTTKDRTRRSITRHVDTTCIASDVCVSGADRRSWR